MVENVDNKEGCRSGRTGLLGEQVYSRGYREFESRPFRHRPALDLIWGAVKNLSQITHFMSPEVKISAIIPAYNEENTIGSVVNALQSSSLVDEIIVVDDGSVDKTAKIASQQGARVIVMPQNQGKGEALTEGVRCCQGDILIFLDADLIGLQPQHIRTLLIPVKQGLLDMSIGTVDRGSLNKYLKFDSPFSGFRVLKKEFWEKVPQEYKRGYFIESALTYFAKIHHLRTQGFGLTGVKHVLKEKKHGLFLGLYYRIKMLAQIVAVNLALRINS